MTKILAVLAGAVALLWSAAHPERWLPIIFGLSTALNPSVDIGPVNIYLSNASVVLWWASHFVKAFLERQIKMVSTELDSKILILFGLAILSTIWFGNQKDSIKRTIAMGIYVISFFGATFYIDSCMDKCRHLYKWIGIGSGVAGLTGVVSLFYYPFRNQAGRGAGAFGNPNALANFILLALPFALACFVLDKRYDRRVAWAAAVIFSIGGLLAARSRGGTVALVFYPLALATMLTRKSAFFTVLIVIVVVCGHVNLYLAGHVNSYFMELFNFVLNTQELYDRHKATIAEESKQSITISQARWTRLGKFEDLPNSLGARMMIWGQALELIEKRPLFGAGIGLCRFSGVPFDCKLFDSAFCTPLTIAADLGITGLIFYVLILVHTIQLLSKSYYSAKTYEQRLFAAVLIASFGAFQIHSMIEDFIFAIMCNWMLGIVTGIIAALPTVIEESQGTSEVFS